MSDPPLQQFDAILFNSQRGLKPIYVHRIREDPSKCFKFIHRREDRFRCYKCDQVSTKTSDPKCTSIVIRNGKFESDPEAIEHLCVETGQLLVYNDLVAQQCYRQGIKLAKREHLFPSIVDQYVRSLIEKRLGSEAAENMQGLVDKRSRYSAYSRAITKHKRKKKDTDEDDGEGSDLDIDADQLEELRRLNQELDVKQRSKPVRPPVLPTISTPSEQSFQEPSSSFESSRQITLNDLINVVDDEEKTSNLFLEQVNKTNETNETNVEQVNNEEKRNGDTSFIGEFGYSKSNKHQILIYRSKRDPDKCFTFVRRRTNACGDSYNCLQCSSVRKAQLNEQLNLDGINVEGNQFQSDPEALYHYCIEAGTVQSYAEVTVRQIQRAALILAEEEKLDAPTIDSLLMDELYATFGDKMDSVLQYLPDRPSRLKSYSVRRTVRNPQLKKPRRETDSGFLYEATYGLSKDGSHPLLIVRRLDDPTKAFTFMHKRDGFFQCSTCLEAYKNESHKYSSPPTIRVTDNFFHMNPEEYDHICLKTGLELPYAKVVAVQCYREVLRMAETGSFDNEALDTMMCEQIRKNLPENADVAINFLPNKKSRFHAYRKRLTNGQQKRQIIQRMEQTNQQEQSTDSNIEEQKETSSLNHLKSCFD